MKDPSGRRVKEARTERRCYKLQVMGWKPEKDGVG